MDIWEIWLHWIIQKPVSNVHDEDIDFVVNVYAQFPVDLQLESATKMIAFLGQLLTLHNQGLCEKYAKYRIKWLANVSSFCARLGGMPFD